MNAISSPIKLEERIVTLDVLRGLAIFGILMVNMPLFYQPMVSMLAGYAGFTSVADFIAQAIIKIFFEGKFYVMFSLLFGYGFYIFIHKPVAEGISIIPVFRRRVFVLLIFGVLHIVLLWPGDILFFYAIFGFILLLFRKVSDRGLAKWAIALASVPVVLTLVFALLLQLAMMVPEAATEIESNMEVSRQYTAELVASTSAAYTAGTFAQMVAARIKEWQVLLPAVVFFYPMVLAMFLTGFWAARKGLLKNTGNNTTFFRKTLIWGFSIGIPASVIYFIAYTKAPGQMANMYTALSTAGHIFGGFFLSLAYISAVVLLVQRGKLTTISRMLAPVGRMALTNYLMHSIICTTLFLNYGFGLFGKVTHWQGILIVLAIFAVQIPLSRWWLEKYRFGPFEWLWRSLTYLKWQPLKRVEELRS